MTERSHSRNRRLFAVLILCFAFVFMFSSQANAQTVKKSSLTMSPKYPVANEKVELKLEAPAIDKDTAHITWRVNGEVVESAYSNVKYTFVVGSAGTRYTVSVSVEDGKGARAYAERTFVVSDIALVWEGVTYTPPFYKGRSLPVKGSDVAFQVLPVVMKSGGTFYNKDELFYAWYTSTTFAPFERGLGKHSIHAPNNLPQEPLEIYVEVKDPSGEIRATKRMRIPVFSPQLTFYEKSPFVGIRYDNAIDDVVSVYGGETTIVAEPYFMTAKTRYDDLLEYTWTIGQNTDNNPGTITLKPEKGSGTELMSLVVKNKSNNYWLQNAKAETKIEFGTEGGWGDPNTEAL